jgi:hypothetical protein
MLGMLLYRLRKKRIRIARAIEDACHQQIIADARSCEGGRHVLDQQRYALREYVS